MAKKESSLVNSMGKARPEKARVQVPEDVRRRMVADAAYFIAQRRGSAEGDPAADWKAAEAQIDELLMDTKSPG